MRVRTLPPIILVAVALTGLAGEAAGRDAATLYAESCAACHGSKGGGLAADSPLLASFEAPPADLTDPMFNSREPAADWFLVVKHGGRRMGLSPQMPGFAGALSDQEIETLVSYLKTLADTRGYPPGDLNFLRAVDTIKAFPEDEFLILTRYESRDPDGVAKNTLYFAWRILERWQAEVKLSHIDDAEVAGLREAELGLKWAFWERPASRLLLAAGAEAELPLRDDGESEVLIPYLSLAKGLGGAATLQATLRSHLPVDATTDEGDVKLSAIVHWYPGPWKRGIFPALETTVTRPFAGQDQLQATLLPQLYAGLSRRGHVALNVAVELPLTDLPYQYRVHAFLLWDMADGPFWEGW